MKRVLLAALLSAAAEADEKLRFERYFCLGATSGYALHNAFGQSEVPTFSGLLLGPEFEYVFAFNDLGISLLGSFRYGKFFNTANNANQREELINNIYSLGTRVYWKWAFLKFAYGYIDQRDVATGLINQSFTLRAHALQTALGAAISIGPHVRLLLSADFEYAKFNPVDEFAARRDTFTYGLSGVLHVVIPSGRDAR